MSYEAHEWETGEIITAEKLNDLEYGLENLSYEIPLIIKFTFYNGSQLRCDYSYEEIYSAWRQNIPILAYIDNGPSTSVYSSVYCNSDTLITTLFYYDDYESTLYIDYIQMDSEGISVTQKYISVQG